MIDVRLPGNDTPTSALGFGCAYLLGGWSTRQSRGLVDQAFELGYRHFDVAPSYGLGTAEDVLGEALRSRRERVTLASKIGIGRPQYGGILLAARQTFAPFKRLHIGRTIARKAYFEATPQGLFDVKNVQHSLHMSLKALRTDHLDLLLLHEVQIEQMTDALLSELARFQRDGKALNIGTATSIEQTQAIRERFGSEFGVWQYSRNVFEQRKSILRPFSITHSPLRRALVQLRNLLTVKPRLAQIFLRDVGIDASDEISLSRLLLGASIAANPNGITLVGSRQSQRIFDNVAVLSDGKWLEAGAALNSLLTSPDGQWLLTGLGPITEVSA